MKINRVQNLTKLWYECLSDYISIPTAQDQRNYVSRDIRRGVHHNSRKTALADHSTTARETDGACKQYE